MNSYHVKKLPSPRFHWRYTFLRGHIHDLLKAQSRLIYTQWKQIPLEEFFFYPDMPYIPLRIQPADTTESASPTDETSLVKRLMHKDAPRFIALAADGGTGKTTLLLKTALDCVHPQGELNEHGFVPAFIDLSHLEPPTPERPLTKDSFYRLIATQTVGGRRFNADDCQRALNYTENARLIFDGLNDILPAVRERMNELSVAFNNFISELHPSSRVIIASREADLLDPLDGKERRFQRFSVQPLTTEESSLYLETVLGNKRTNEMLTTLGTQNGPLRNPKFLQLCSMMYSEHAEGELSRELIYRKAIQTWLQKQFEKGNFRHFARPGHNPVDGIYQLLQRLAVEMIQLGRGWSSQKDAIELIESCQSEDWYPVDESKNPIDKRVIYGEVFQSGLLRLVR